MKKVHLSVVIPVYNEAKRIEKCLVESLAYLQSAKGVVGFEIIFVSEPSTDGTNEMIRAFIDKYPKQKIRLMMNDQKEGKGYSVKKGFLAADNDWVLFYDVDLSVSPRELDIFLKYIENYDIVIASRLVQNAKVERAVIRKMISFLLYALRKLLLNTRIKDSQCGFKLFNKQKCKSIFQTLETKDFFFDVELLFLAEQKGLRMKEVPVAWTEDPSTKYNTLKTSIHFFVKLVRLRVSIKKY